VEAQLDFSQWASEVDGLYDSLISSGDVDTFISSLASTNANWIQEFANRGFTSVNGLYENATWAAEHTTRFINGFLEGFKVALERPNAISELRWRAFMYPNEASRMAYVVGQQQAMRDMGARAWRRELHPERSRTGPCQLCIDDSRLIHPISEPFILLHPGDVCDVASVIVYYPTEQPAPGIEPMAEMPVPGRFPPIVQMIRDFLERLGHGAQSIVRRVLNK
jgi:hypothetical protein